MRTTMRLLFGAVFLLLTTIPLVSSAGGLSRKELYEFGSLCSRDAARVFKENNGRIGTTTEDSNTNTTNFTDHYNVSQNKCFMLVDSLLLQKKGGYSQIKDLVDVNENHIIGEFVKTAIAMECYVSDQYCHSEKEWQLLVSPYMQQ